jgi:antitoxin PrlF
MAQIMESSITVKGQATIPKAVREHLRLKPGDRVKFFIHPNGTVVILPRLPITSLKGIVKPRKAGRVSVEQMNEAIAAGATARFTRRRK